MNSKQVKERSCCTKCTSNNSVQDVLALLLCQTPTCCQTYSSVTKAWQDLKLWLGQSDIRKEHPNLDNESNTPSFWYMTLILSLSHSLLSSHPHCVDVYYTNTHLICTLINQHASTIYKAMYTLPECTLCRNNLCTTLYNNTTSIV